MYYFVVAVDEVRSSLSLPPPRSNNDVDDFRLADGVRRSLLSLL
jgi:hypothetical protein